MYKLELSENEARLIISAGMLGLKGSKPVIGLETDRFLLVNKLLKLSDEVLNNGPYSRK